MTFHHYNSIPYWKPENKFYCNGFPISTTTAELLYMCGVRQWWLDFDLATNTNRFEANPPLVEFGPEWYGLKMITFYNRWGKWFLR